MEKKVDREKLDEARALIDELLAEEEEYEVQEVDPNLVLEETAMEDVDSVPVEELEEEAEEGDMTEEDERTQLYDTPEEYQAKKLPPDVEDQEGDEEESCPYCGTTLKSLLAGDIVKSDGGRALEADCPQCGTTWSIDSNRKVTVSGTNADEDIKKLDAAYAVIDQLLIENDRLAKAVSDEPRPRKFKVIRKSPEYEEVEDNKEISKADEELQKDVDKAKVLRKMEQDGKVLTPEDRQFCESTLNKLLDNKYGKK